MFKITQITSWLRQKLSIYNINIFHVLIIYAIINLFTFHGNYNYTKIPIENIDQYLFKQTNPNLVLKAEANCDLKYVLESSRSVKPQEIPIKFVFSLESPGEGNSSPDHCNPVFSVAIIVPYRNRKSQLDVFLPYMHIFLRRQNIHFKIYLVEQQDEKPFNRGLLFNVGATRAISDGFPCLILHDVDLLPLDDVLTFSYLSQSNLYACLNMPRHMSASIDRNRYVLANENIIGGALAIRADQYAAINGFSNRIEDNSEYKDLKDRIQRKEMKILRFPQTMSRYTKMVYRQPKSKKHWFDTKDIINEDGITSMKYDMVTVKDYKLFTLVGVKI